MLQIFDQFLPSNLVGDLRLLCTSHARLRQHLDGDALFSWRPDHGAAQSAHTAEDQTVMEQYLSRHLLDRIAPYAPDRIGVEWWCNTNNDLDWHIDKDECEGRSSGRYELPLLSTVFYPHVSCAGGELLVADSTPIHTGHVGDLPSFRSVISIPPVVNRLVLFTPGVLHRINPFEGERYSVAVNIWGRQPLSVTTAESVPRAAVSSPRCSSSASRSPSGMP